MRQTKVKTLRKEAVKDGTWTKKSFRRFKKDIANKHKQQNYAPKCKYCNGK